MGKYLIVVVSWSRGKHSLTLSIHTHTHNQSTSVSNMSSFRETIAVKHARETLAVIQHLLRPGDNVIEIGSQLNELTIAMRDIVVVNGGAGDGAAGDGDGGGTLTAFDFDKKMAKRDGLESFRRVNQLEGVNFHILTGTKGRFKNGNEKQPFQVASTVLSCLLLQGEEHEERTKKYRVVVLDLSNLYGNELFLDFVVAIDIFKCIFSALGMEYLIVKSCFMRSAARKYLNAAQLLDQSCNMIGTKCHILWNQFTSELHDSILNNRVGYSGECVSENVVFVSTIKLFILVKSYIYIHCFMVYSFFYFFWNNTDPGPVVLGTRGVNEYRKASLLCVQSGDRVLEIGCHCGKTTKLLGK